MKRDYHYDVVQGTDEWKLLKAGMFSSSNFSKLMGSKTKSERHTYLHEILSERITDIPSEERYYDKAMKRGNKLEPRARALHGLKIGEKIREVGFVTVGGKWDGWVCCSTDGLIGEDGIFETKSANNAVQIWRIYEGRVPTQHRFQIQGGLLVTGRKFCDFVSYNPDAGLKYEYFHKRVFRDEELIREIEQRIDEGIEEVTSWESKLKGQNLTDVLTQSIKKEATV